MNILYLLLLLNFSSQGEVAETDTTKGLNWVAFGITTGAITGFVIYLWPSLEEAWWKQTGKFHWEHFESEMRYKNIDQLGHVYVAMEISKLFTTTTELWNLPKPYPDYIGPSFSTLFLGGIELKDAYTPEHGFGKVDFLANTIGAWYPFAQKRIPVLKKFNLKYSYWPSEEKKQGKVDFVWDYGGMTYWLSADLHDLLPEGNIVPSWLNPAFGYGGTRHSTTRDAMEHRELYLGLDLNLPALPGKSPILTKTKALLNGWHFPMPAVRLYPDKPKFYLLFYGP
jgi:hypothetical protein